MQRRDVMLGAAALWSLGAWAQPPAPTSPLSTAPADFPRPGATLRLVVPAAQGSLTDVIVRWVEEPLARDLGLRVAVEQRPGDAGQTGAAVVAQAAPDGYTLGAVTLGHVASATRRRTQGDDLLRGLKPVALLASSPIVAVVSASSRLRTASDLLAGSAASGRLTAASGGNGTPAHLTLALFNDVTKASLAHRPQPGGTSPVDAVRAGRADLVFADLAEALPHLEAGHLRALMIAGVARHPRLPEVPTTAEVGLPTLLVENWTGLMAPKQTPDLIVDKLDSALVKIMLSPDVESRAAAAGLRVDARPAGKFAAFLDAEASRWGKLIGAADIRVK